MIAITKQILGTNPEVKILEMIPAYLLYTLQFLLRYYMYIYVYIYVYLTIFAYSQALFAVGVTTRVSGFMSL